LVVSKIVKKHAYDFASGQSAVLAGKTIVNRVSYVSQCLTYAERKGIITSNPFVGLTLDGYGRSQESYTPLDRKQLDALFKLTMPDEDRKLLSILITTGMRLDEAALLTWEDVKDEGGIPYFDLTVKGKKIKNIGSARKVPIVPVLLKVLGTKETGRLFSYKTDKDGKAQSAASKALMRHIKKVRGTDTSKVVHSLRGSFKDMLRDEEVSKETNDFLTGHGSGDVAGGYGSGPSLKVRYDALCKVKHPWLA
jgi:integrase